MTRRALRLIALFVAAALAMLIHPARAANPDPTATINAPQAVQLGGTFSFTVSFDKRATATTGFGPFVDLAYDATGPDGVSKLPYDGLTVSTTIDFLGSRLPGSYVQEFTFDDTANGGLGVPHPFAEDTVGNEALDDPSSDPSLFGPQQNSA